MTIACKNTFEKLVVTVWAPRILLQKGEIAKRKKKESIHPFSSSYPLWGYSRAGTTPRCHRVRAVDTLDRSPICCRANIEKQTSIHKPTPNLESQINLKCITLDSDTDPTQKGPGQLVDSNSGMACSGAVVLTTTPLGEIKVATCIYYKLTHMDL